MTFSIVAYDPKTGEFGVAVESKFLAVGSAVPFAQAGVGAIATQAWANTSYGPRGLRLLKRGLTPRQVAKQLTLPDKDADQRQFGIVDVKGRAFSYTGAKCFDWAGGITGKNFSAQGNILAGAEVVQELARAFQESQGSLAERLVAALQAGQRAGGDRRGQESAALLVVRLHGGYGGFNDRYLDLRVDDHPHPIDELERLLGLHHLYLGKPRVQDRIKIDSSIALELQKILAGQGYPVQENGVWDQGTEEAFDRFCGVENLEERFMKGGMIDRVVLEFLRKKYG
jgi:uncharacterized Ntn-hydrolase superfamily protein